MSFKLFSQFLINFSHKKIFNNTKISIQRVHINSQYFKAKLRNTNYLQSQKEIPRIPQHKSALHFKLYIMHAHYSLALKKCAYACHKNQHYDIIHAANTRFGCIVEAKWTLLVFGWIAFEVEFDCVCAHCH